MLKGLAQLKRGQGWHLCHAKKLRKNKVKHKAYILRTENKKFNSNKMRAKVDEKVKKVENKEKKFFKGISILFSRMKLRILNIFKNLFKKQHAIQQT